MADNNAKVRLELDAGGFDDEANSVKVSSEQAEEAIEQMGASATEAGAKLQDAAQRMNQMGDAATQQAQQVERLSATLKDLNTYVADQKGFGGAGDVSFESAKEQLSWQRQYHSAVINDIQERKLAENDRHQAAMRGLEAELTQDKFAAAGQSKTIQDRIALEKDRHKEVISGLNRERSEATITNRNQVNNLTTLAREEKQLADQKKADLQQIAAEERAEEQKKADARKKELADYEAIKKARQEAAQPTYTDGKGETRALPSEDYAALPLVKYNEELKNSTQLLREKDKAQQQELAGLSNTRYALYDVAATYRMVGVAATGVITAQVANSAAMESAFTGVERTVDLPLEKMEQLRSGLIDLSRTIPESFDDIANIATIGGQLDVAGEHIEDFSKNVAMFAAMTDASIDQTAMSFGRIDQLANAGAGSYDNIASAIYLVGVQTVATESEILKMSEEISATAAIAGYTADEIIGLAGALSSLAVQPERARGAMEQTFRAISDAVNNGGDKLQAFANLSGQSADAFAEQWRSAPAEAFDAFIGGLSQVSDFDGALNQLGLSGLRVSDTLKRLANNQSVLTEAMGYANSAWSDHTDYLGAYEMVADDLSSQMKMLVADIRAIMDAMTDNAALTFFVEKLRDVLNVIYQITNNDFGKWVGAGVTALLGLVAAVTLVKAGMLTLQAGTYALITAQQSLTTTNFKLSHGIKMLGGQLLGLKFSFDAATGSLVKTNTLAQGLGVTLKGLTGGAWGIGIMAGVTALGALLSQIQSTKAGAEEMRAAFSGLGSAIQQDTEIYNRTGEAIQTFTFAMDGSVIAVGDSKTSFGELHDSVIGVAEGFGFSTDAIETNTVALGENALMAVQNALVNNEALINSFREMGPTLDELGISAEGFGEALLNQNVDEYLADLQDFVSESEEIAERMAQNYDILVADPHFVERTEDLRDGLNTMLAAAQAYAEGIETAGIQTQLATGIMADSAYDAADGAYELENSVANLGDTMFGAEQDIAAFEAAMYNLGGSMYENGNAFDVYSEAGRANMAALVQVVNAASQAAGNDVQALATMLAQALQAIGGTGTEIGRLFVVQAQAAVDNLAAFTGQATQSVAGLVGQVNNQSFAMGRAAKAAQGYSRANRGAGRSARSAGQGAAAAAKEIRTLTDYVKDLSSVMKSAFDFRWGLQQSVDGVADAFQKLQDMKTDAIDRVNDAFEGLEDSRQKITDLRLELSELNSDLNSLSADRGTLEYQLKVAQDYGDSLREKEILAQLEKNQQDVAKAENDRQKITKGLVKAQKDEADAAKELSDAQRDVKRNLTGTTESSREQRSAVLALVQSYQDQVEQLANSGLSQQQLAIEVEKLRQKFVAQMQQLGYSRAEADKYSQSFVDMTKIINQIPRNITISANTNPAQRAIDEFRAKNTGGRGASAPISTPIKAVGGNAAGVRNSLQNYMNRNPLSIPTKLREVATGKYVRIGGRVGVDYLLSAYKSGGYTGKGNKNDIAGLTHKGEYVVPAHQVDQTTGLPYLSALGDIMQGSRSSSGISSSSVGMPTSMVVELSPTDRKLIADGSTAVVVLDGKVIASSVNSNNASSSRRGA